MSQLEERHEEAMDLAEFAFRARRKGNEAEAIRMFCEALAIEIEVLEHFSAPLPESEPTRAILFRSGAALAYHAGKYEQSAQLIAEARRGAVPPEINAELDDLQARLVAATTPSRQEQDYPR